MLSEYKETFSPAPGGWPKCPTNCVRLLRPWSPDTFSCWRLRLKVPPGQARPLLFSLKNEKSVTAPPKPSRQIGFLPATGSLNLVHQKFRSNVSIRWHGHIQTV